MAAKFHKATKAGTPAKAIQNSSTRIGMPKIVWIMITAHSVEKMWSQAVMITSG